MSTSTNSNIFGSGSIARFLVLALSLSGLSAGAALAQDCSEVQYRLWRKGAEASWYTPGETLQVTSGEEVHLYIHTLARGSNRYSTSAEIGYPGAFGFGGKARDVLRHLRMKAQNADDRRSGRVVITAQEPGTARLGYRIEAVKPPGNLSRVPAGCRQGVVTFAVSSVDRPAPAPAPAPAPTPAPSRGTSRDAAAELVGLLFEGILRRPLGAGTAEGYVDSVLRDGLRGVEDVATRLTTSDEFRYEVLRRVEEERGRSRDLDRLRETLLDSMYRDLYGYVTPSRADRDDDLEDLDICLSNERDSERACASLGRNLVASDLFVERHEDLLDRVERRTRRRR
ncbi:MAG: hypothetical protein AAF725_11210 [Acidobacteriota bacterium]